MRLSVVKTERGIALIAAIFLIVVVAFFGLIVVSLMSTQGYTSVSEMQSDQAFYIAEGGMEFTQRALAQNLDWYRSASDPIASGAINLGAGSFSVNASLPATVLRNQIQTGSTNPIRVYTTNRFPAAGFLQINEDLTGEGEFIQYTGIAGNTFTGITRDITINGVNGTGTIHDHGDRIYPVTTLSVALPNNCTSVSVSLAAHTKFLGAGTLDIEGEEIGYTASTTAGGVMTLTGVTRCRNGTASAAHAANAPVTPILPDGAAPDFEAEISSNGTVVAITSGNATRVVRKTVQR
jgi:Tfp pilus assembly protein PilX